MKTHPTECLTDMTPVVNKTLVYNHKDFYAPPTAIMASFDFHILKHLDIHDGCHQNFKNHRDVTSSF